MSVVFAAALQFLAELLSLYSQGKLDAAKAKTAVDAAIAALHPVGPAS